MNVQHDNGERYRKIFPGHKQALPYQHSQPPPYCYPDKVVKYATNEEALRAIEYVMTVHADVLKKLIDL